MSVTKIQPFHVEQWMDNHETWAKYNIAETCAASISIQDLENLCEDKSHPPILDTTKKLVYGAIRGTDALRNNLAALYSGRAPVPLPKENILITPGAIAANYLVLYTLLGKGDHVICHYPTYQQLYEVPASFGAEVTLWKAKEEKKWQLDVEDVKAMIKPNTKMIIINNPNNPTGALLTKSFLRDLVDVCRAHSIILFADEVYRPLFHSITPMDPEFPLSILNMNYSLAIASGSLSKAYSLAGIRVGWIAARDPTIIEALASVRDYTTISVSQVDEQIAAFAVGPYTVHALLTRNIELAKTNLALLDAWVEKHRWACEWVKPVAGSTGFVKFQKMGTPVDDVVFCQTLQEKSGVMFVPGSRCFGEEFKGYVRVGFVCETEVLREGLDALTQFMKTDYKNIPEVA